MSDTILEEKAMPSFKWLDLMAKLLDNRFRIPLTKKRFGLDGILGLFPWAGDVLCFLVSGVLIIYMARYGGSGMLAVKMMRNILTDGIVGTVPIAGDAFDFRYKANLRNVKLLKAYYQQGQHRGSARWVIWFIVLGILGSIIASIALSVWVMSKLLHWIVS